MNKQSHAQTLLAEPDEALVGYLQNLLDEIPAPEAPASEMAAPVSTCGIEKIAESLNPAVETRPETSSLPQQATETEVAVDVDIRLDCEDGLPEWADTSFQSLSFRAAGREFSLPLVCMKRIVRLDKPLTCLPGLPAWHLGLLGLRGEKVGVIDLARLLRGGEGTQCTRNEYVLILDDGCWGLACEHLGQAVRLEVPDVRWRQVRGKPRFMEGVVEKSLTPLLSTRDILRAVNK